MNEKWQSKIKDMISMGSDYEVVERQSTGIQALDMIIGGGLPKGKNKDWGSACCSKNE